MKRVAIVSFLLVALFLVSVFPLSTLYGAADSHGSPGLLGSQSTVDPPDWWPMFHHDLTHTGYSTSPIPTTNQTLWNYTTSLFVQSSPAVAGGVVYVGSLDHNVYALNATTGAQVWNYTTGGEVVSSPAVAGGFVYVGSDDDKVYAFGPGVFLSLYALNITTTAGGMTAPSPGTYTFPSGTVVNVTATANAGYVFEHWELDTVNVGAGNPYSVLMNQNHTLNAMFVQQRAPQTVGGYSFTLVKAPSSPPLALYVTVLAAFGAIMSLLKRRRTSFRRFFRQ
jgi:hypothetical protein